MVMASKDDASGLTAFVTVGTTLFDGLISVSTSSEFLHALAEQGCRKLTLQIGNGKEPDLPNQTAVSISWQAASILYLFHEHFVHVLTLYVVFVGIGSRRRSMMT